MVRSELKYRINHFLGLLPQQLSIAEFAFLLKTDFKILNDEFKGDRFLKMNDARVIPPERLRVYALLFRVAESQ